MIGTIILRIRIVAFDDDGLERRKVGLLKGAVIGSSIVVASSVTRQVEEGGTGARRDAKE